MAKPLIVSYARRLMALSGVTVISDCTGIALVDDPTSEETSE